MKYLVVEQNYEYNDEGYTRTDGYSALFVTDNKKFAQDKVIELSNEWANDNGVDEIRERLSWDDRDKIEHSSDRDEDLYELSKNELLAKMKELNITLDLYNIEEVEEL